MKLKVPISDGNRSKKGFLAFDFDKKAFRVDYPDKLLAEKLEKDFKQRCAPKGKKTKKDARNIELTSFAGMGIDPFSSEDSAVVCALQVCVDFGIIVYPTNRIREA